MDADDRLSRMIGRLCTQRACLDFAAGELAALAGPILEVGLGKGRTYDRLRTLFPDRIIYVFDREVHCPADVVPPAEHLWLGDFRESLASASEALGRNAALVHADIGSDDRQTDAALAAAIAPLLDRLVVPGGLVLSDREMPVATWRALPQPDAAHGWRYYLYRVG